MQRVAIFLICAAFSGGFARAAEQWLRLTTPHFEVLTTAGEKKGREGIQYFESVRQFFIDAKFAADTPGKRVRIVAFRGDKEFRPYAPNESAAAFYAGGADNDYIVLSQIGYEYYPVAVHEYTHLLLRHGTANLPVWLNEGLAEVLSTLRPEGKRMIVAEIIRPHVAELYQSRLIDLDTLFAVGPDSKLYNERAHVGLFYSESWALTHMLYTSPEYAPRFGVFWNAVLSGGGVVPALREAYGKSPAEVQKDLLGYIARDRYGSRFAPVQLDKQSETPEVAPLEAWDANLALAEIMSTSQRKAALGQQMLEKLMGEQPTRWEPPALLGDLALREGKPNDAIDMFGKAVTLGSTNPETYFRYAMLLWNRGGGNDEKIRSALRKAVDLKPDYTEARLRLGFALMDHSEYKQALEELKQAKGVKKDDAFSFLHAVAYCSYRVGDEKGARAVLEQARKYAVSAADRMALDQLGQALDHSAEAASSGGREVEQAEAQTGEAETVVVAKQWPRMEGTLNMLECNGNRARLAIASGGKIVWFLIEDPATVRMTHTGTGTAAVDFTCGKQPPKPVTIEYQARDDSETKTAGVVRGIEFH